jgi:mannose-1-phosphate guanylyltransferase/phosphomannomutase
MKAVILVGGKGTRLKPFTEALPKPMLPIGVRPLLEITIKYLRNYSFNEVILATNYLKEYIMHYFGDGSRFGINIEYSVENNPLGTAGAVKNAAKLLKDTFVVILGDVIADIDYPTLIKYHKEKGAIGTMVIVNETVEVPYGVLDIDTTSGNEILNFSEKPSITFPVYAGIVVLEPEALNYVRDGEFLHMPDLFLRLKEHDKKIVAYPHEGTWIDIGQNIEQYLNINQKVVNKNIKFNKKLSDVIFKELGG